MKKIIIIVVETLIWVLCAAISALIYKITGNIEVLMKHPYMWLFCITIFSVELNGVFLRTKLGRRLTA